MSATAKPTRQRVPASERRDALIEAAVHEFARRGLYGTPVDGIARRVGVAQPYVFSLFGSKKELFLAAVERGFDRTAALFTRAAGEFDPDKFEPGADVLHAMGAAYRAQLVSDPDYLMLQHQAYAACGDEEIRERVRSFFARLVARVEQLTGDEISSERIDEFFRYGMWLNVAAAMGVEDLSAACDWVHAAQES